MQAGLSCRGGRGFAEVRLLTHQKMLAHIALYTRLGYVETARRVEDSFARVFMAKRLAG